MKLFKKKELTIEEEALKLEKREEEQRLLEFDKQLRKALKQYPRRLRKRYYLLWIEYQKGNILKIGEENGKVSREV